MKSRLSLKISLVIPVRWPERRWAKTEARILVEEQVGVALRESRKPCSRKLVSNWFWRTFLPSPSPCKFSDNTVFCAQRFISWGLWRQRNGQSGLKKLLWQKQPKCPSKDEWISKMWCIHTWEYYSVIERKHWYIPQHGWTLKILCSMKATHKRSHITNRSVKL